MKTMLPQNYRTRQYMEIQLIFAQGLFWRMNKTPNGHLKISHTGGTFGFSGYCVLILSSILELSYSPMSWTRDSQGQLVNAADKIFESVLPLRSK